MLGACEASSPRLQIPIKSNIPNFIHSHAYHFTKLQVADSIRQSDCEDGSLDILNMAEETKTEEILPTEREEDAAEVGSNGDEVSPIQTCICCLLADRADWIL